MEEVEEKYVVQWLGNLAHTLDQFKGRLNSHEDDIAKLRSRVKELEDNEG